MPDLPGVDPSSSWCGLGFFAALASQSATHSSQSFAPSEGLRVGLPPNKCSDSGIEHELQADKQPWDMTDNINQSINLSIYLPASALQHPADRVAAAPSFYYS